MSATHVADPHHHHAVADKTQLAPEKSHLGLTRPDRHSGIIDWLTTVDHKKIGIMYGAAAMFFFLVGGIEALLIRAQLATSENHLITAELYNQLFTMHGTTMIFLGVMPLSAAFFNFLVPLQIGARDVAFPRLNTFSLWTFIAGALVLNVSWFFQFAHTVGWLGDTLTIMGKNQDLSQIAPAGGWFGYAPLTGRDYTGIGTDFWIVGLQILGVASLAASFNFIVTILNMRAPGMTMMRLPVFTWMTLITSFLIIFAFPAITIALAELMFDRLFNTNFFRIENGGQPILWQHLFWVFGHPEVYILVLPAMGIVSEILPTFSRKPLFGYPIIVFSGAVIGFLGFAVWSHHMFTTGLGKIATAAFSLLTMAIAVPTGVKIFNWMGSLWGGRIKFTVPMVFALGFIWMFMMGGFTGIMHSSAPADAQQQDSYFVVAHFHYVLLGGVLLGLLAGLYFWVPKIFGRMPNQKLGYLTAVLVIAGFNITFFPMHYLGLTGMPRRTHTYLGDMGWDLWNLVATIGAFILGIGVFLCFVNLAWTAVKGPKSPADPWDGRTLEWSTPTPVPAYNFAATPIVQARDCYWVHKHGDKKMEYMPGDGHGIHMPSQSWWPLLCGIGFSWFGISMAMFGGGVPFAGYSVIAGLGMVFLGVYLWALEGPGGYHLEPPHDENKSGNPKDAPVAHAAH
ncbi:cytochrome c oxidase subunit I [Cerasicoccus fimbriatus]|uniref:cytochrome c oxidase subunit I n=1 Tax=Cerasicoccus fimbriatus TaxID=3014554 RepID=UPI0022B3A986|nr:cytochrome c oxidase subunit I [Cerasicoccus sp. TK19100]